MTSYRQSLLASYEQCPRRALLGRDIDDDLTVGNVGSSADLGSAFHAIAAEMLRTLWRQGEQQMPTQEAVEIMREVMANGADRLNVTTGETTRTRWVLTAQDRDDLRWMVLGFAGRRWQPQRILPDGTDLDPNGGRLSADVVCPDGDTRTITGQPDLIIADPPDGVVIVDYKSGRGQPKAPRNDRDAEVATGKQYLSERGHFQLDSYGLMGMRKYPSANRAILRELHLRSGKVREAVLTRDELEHVEVEIGLHLMLLDQAIETGETQECPVCEGVGLVAVDGPAGVPHTDRCPACDGSGDVTNPLWKPRPGAWCARACPVSVSCPIPAEQRGAGALDSDSAADEAAARYVTTDGVRNTLRDQLKTRYEQTGRPSYVGDGTAIFWKEKDDGRRSFGVWPVEDIPAGPDTDAELEAVAKELGL